MYYIANSNVPININLVTTAGVGVIGLAQSSVNIKLVRSGITILNGVTGDYTFSEQHNGIYRIVLGDTLTTIADTDYILIAIDLTSQAIDDKVEFTLYNESIDSVYTKLKSEVDANETILNTININTDAVENLLTNATYGLSVIKTSENNLSTQLTNVENAILNEVISRDRLTNINNLSSQVSTSENNVIAEVNQIPINPLLTNDSRLVNIDTPISTRSTLQSSDVWSYVSRQLTGVSGVNQINVNNFMSQFIVNEDLYIDIDMVTTSTVPVTGLSYPTTMDIILYKAGVKQTLSTLTVGATGLEEGVYRIKLDKSLMNMPKIDYILIIKDLTATAVTYKRQFSLFEVVGADSAYQADIIVKDINTNLLVPDVNVYVKNNDQSLLISKGTTNINGSLLLSLGIGEYKVLFKKSFIDFTVPEVMTVSSSGSTTFTFWGSGFSPSTPSQPETCIVYGWVSDISGNFVKGAKVTLIDPINSRYSGLIKIVKITKSTLTNSEGYFELEGLRNSQLTPSNIKYTITITYPGFEYSKEIFIPNSATADFSAL